MTGASRRKERAAMQRIIRSLPAVLLGVYLLGQAGMALGQPRPITQAECQAIRGRLAEHARLSDGVRRAVASQAARYPAPAPAAAAPLPQTAPSNRATRLEQIARERQQLDDLRLAALVKFDLSRALQLQGQIQALDDEKAALENQPPEAQARPANPMPPQPAKPSLTDVERLPCEEIAGAQEAAIKIRRKELGAREDQAGVVPLLSLKGQRQDQIAQELAPQFVAWPGAATQLGVLDQDGDGRLEAFVDLPVRDVFRLYRQRSDGTLGIEVFALPGRAADTSYDEMTRRLDEAAARQAARPLADVLASRPAGPIRVLAETRDFAGAYGNFLAGNFAEAAKVEGAAARTSEYPNLRGETCRLLEVIAPIPGGVVMRRMVNTPAPNSQQIWDETLITVRPASYWRIDAEVLTSRQTRNVAGAPVATPSSTGPVKISIER
jgi:hypothetical protein